MTFPATREYIRTIKQRAERYRDEFQPKTAS
jgi:hypothetical protein